MAIPAAHPQVPLRALDVLWFQVAGTLCNLACRHCLVSSSPTNRTHEMMTLEQVRPHLEQGARLGVKEYYFTGGEPFLNPEMEDILSETLRFGPATVLTNGLRLDAARCSRLRRLAARSAYSLDLRVSLDGHDAVTNDAVRGGGTFARVLQALHELARAGFDPVVTVTAACDGAASGEGRTRLLGLLRQHGIEKPRLKILPLFRIGAEVRRSRPYEGWQRLAAGDLAATGTDHLQCSSSRMVTSQGVWVCPILVNEPAARMGEALGDALDAFTLSHSACWTCHVEGATCRT
jgi:sulfatase maturation enzyme AslB (radical SAM superfamily)